MSPRPWLEKVEDYSSYRTGVAYRCLVTALYKVRNPNSIEVELEHLDEPQVGRPLTVRFQRPIRPAGLAARFFRACSVDITANAKFAPQDAIGQKLLVSLARSRDGQWRPIRFETIPEEPACDAAE